MEELAIFCSKPKIKLTEYHIKYHYNKLYNPNQPSRMQHIWNHLKFREVDILRESTVKRELEKLNSRLIENIPLTSILR
jgi:hypothetical protein